MTQFPSRNFPVLAPRTAPSSLNPMERARQFSQSIAQRSFPVPQSPAMQRTQQQIGALNDYRAAAGGYSNDLLDRIERLEAGFISPQGGPVSSGGRDKNIAAYASPPQVGKGGILELSFVTFAAAAAADTAATAVITDATRSRMTETFIEYVGVVAEGDLADMDELRKMQIQLLINGRPIAACDRVPADALAPDLSSLNLIPVMEYVGADADVTCIFTVTRALTTTVASSISLRAYCGNGQTFGR